MAFETYWMYWEKKKKTAAAQTEMASTFVQ